MASIHLNNGFKVVLISALLISLSELCSARRNIFRRRDNGPYPYDTGGVALQETCLPTEFYEGFKAQTAVEDAAILIRAALTAVGSPDSVPFDYFFNPADAPIVEGIFDAILNAIVYAQGPAVDIWCADWGINTCAWADAYADTQGPQEGRAAITLCPKILSVARGPPPCTYDAGILGIGYFMLHELLQINTLTGMNMSNTAYGARNCSALRGPGLATSNADNYSQLAIWAWGLGLGAEPYTGPQCTNLFSHGNFDVIVIPIDGGGTTPNTTWGQTFQYVKSSSMTANDSIADLQTNLLP
ncbi:hypothetical protein MMC12_003109 [Toensbergia leucococca]|nr:hypothetical protein [Toensbergia leucococca]